MSQGPEAKTRTELIDPALKKAGWDVNNPRLVGLEVPVDGTSPEAWQQQKQALQERDAPYAGSLPSGICDYVLYSETGDILAVVEAKKTTKNPQLAEAQAVFYVDEIARRQSFRPFAFLTNGHEIYFLDPRTGARRLVQGFFSPADLANMRRIEQEKLPLASLPINPSITDRAYQHEAVRRVCEAFDAGKRKTLLVMATGTGKTRTAMSIIDLFIRANQARRILFVADRDALVEQALTDGFKRHIPHEPAMRLRSQTPDNEMTARLYAVTLQTLSQCLDRFTPGYFDLLIFDEVHRSIFDRWNEVLHYFDGRMVGLTATPSTLIDHNTLLEFDCTQGVPTFVYDYPTAIHEGYLVDYTLYKAETRFQRAGIRGVDLTEEERNILIEQGIDPDNLDYAGTDLEQTVSNLDTLRQQWSEIWEHCYKDESGQLPGKTIIFAMTQEHALRLANVFAEMYPNLADLVQVITHQSEYKGTLINGFKRKPLPRIAISVDMLDTGIDVPEVVNLVFMKPVQSQIKLQQMIGRGTRNNATCSHPELLPNGHKDDFLIIDFWENDFNKQPNTEKVASLPVLVTIWNTRLRLLEEWLKSGTTADREALVGDLRAQVAQLPRDAFPVKKLWPEINAVWTDEFWQYLPLAKLNLLRLKVGPLLRYVANVDVEAATFTSKIERLKLQIVTGKDTATTLASIREDVARIPSNLVQNDPQAKQAISLCLSPSLATASPTELRTVVAALAPQMKNRASQPNAFLVLDLPDFIANHGYILLQGGSQPVYVAEYRKQVEQRVLGLVDDNPTLQALGSGMEVGDAKLLDLERTLRQELGGDLHLNEQNIRSVYALKVDSLLGFIRQLLGLEQIPDYAEIVQRQVDGFIKRHTFGANQILFVRTLGNAIAQRRRFQPGDLFKPPVSNVTQAVDQLFAPAELEEVVSFARSLSVRES
ncbi:MAG: DEAD/DEAH box helicase family protein [Herpetosiphonaceae bacterium]|nr:DEAD/DEAH box helicase family protein [Herpetosiphonaceae bacterium]